MRNNTPGLSFLQSLLHHKPDAAAWVTGNHENPQLNGLVKFYMTPYGGTLIEAEIFGLPNLKTPEAANFYAMHIHENGDCTLPFDKTGNHYNPTKEPHPQHSGDLIPLFGNQGYAWAAFYDKRFAVPEIIGKSLIIHSMPDDFTTQPSGNSGEKIGCGVIR